jgi:hypothetical protein
MSRNTSSSSSSSGIGFAGLLTIVFIVLKLLHKIGWSWWWVVSPLWIGAALAIVIIGLVLGVAAIVATVKR